MMFLEPAKSTESNLGNMIFIIDINDLKKYVQKYDLAQYCDDAQVYKNFTKNNVNIAVVGLNRCLVGIFNNWKENGLRSKD